MDRLERLRALVDVAQGRGLEVGPLTRPTVTPELGTIFYADHASTEDLRAKYRPDPHVDIELLTPVDFVLGAVTLPVAAAAEAPFDYVIASHVIEHVPDVVGWLGEVTEVLTPGGRLSLCVPDRRFSFDVRRRPSEVAEAVEAHLLQLRRPAVRATFDHFYRHVEVDAVALWRTEVSYADRPLDVRVAFEESTRSAETEEYVDTHCWVCSDREFLELYRELAGMGLVDLAVVSATPTAVDDHEFFVTLEKLPSGLTPDEVRRRVLDSIPDLVQTPRPAPPEPEPAPPEPQPVPDAPRELDGREFRLSEREIRAVQLKRAVLTRLRRALHR
jgi:SAM-dependent methyltransferase